MLAGAKGIPSIFSLVQRFKELALKNCTKREESRLFITFQMNRLSGEGIRELFQRAFISGILGRPGSFMGQLALSGHFVDAMGFDFIVILRHLSLLFSDLIILHCISLCPACVFVAYLTHHLMWVYCHWIRWVWLTKPPELFIATEWGFRNANEEFI